MPKTHIQLLTKNGGLLGDRIEIDTQIIPRVGELIDAREFLREDANRVSDYMVLSVIYKLTKNGFVPYISARQWYKGLRHELLAERGWLAPQGNELAYDEDDQARLENA